MKNIEIGSLLNKVDELRALFVLGQNVIPFLEEIFIFVNDIKPLLEDINLSITENLKKMPSASQQLSKVTEATELATTEIMDLVDGILVNVDFLQQNFEKLDTLVNLQNNKTLETLKTIYDAIDAGVDAKDLLPELKNIIVCFDNRVIAEKDETINKSNEFLQLIQNDSTSIMMSLQVQDITSQQIAAVNKLLETLQTRLISILTHFNESDLNELIKSEVEPDRSDFIRVSKLHRDIAFDPQAVDSIANKEFKQNEVDQYIINIRNNREFIKDTRELDISENKESYVPNKLNIETNLQDDVLLENDTVNFDKTRTQFIENEKEFNSMPPSEDLIKDEISNDKFEDNVDLNIPFSQEDIDKMFK